MHLAVTSKNDKNKCEQEYLPTVVVHIIQQSILNFFNIYVGT